MGRVKCSQCMFVIRTALCIKSSQVLATNTVTREALEVRPCWQGGEGGRQQTLSPAPAVPAGSGTGLAGPFKGAHG